MTSRFAMSAHVLGLLAWHQQQGSAPVTSEELARSVNTNPVVIRRVLGELRRAGLVETRRGAGGGTVLARPAEQITLRDAYEAVAEDARLLKCAPGTADTACGLGLHLHAWLIEVFGDAEEALKARLDQTSVADMAAEVAGRLEPCAS